MKCFKHAAIYMYKKVIGRRSFWVPVVLVVLAVASCTSGTEAKSQEPKEGKTMPGTEGPMQLLT